jgi:hypothetical protein
MKEELGLALVLALVLKTTIDKVFLFRYTSCLASPRFVHLAEVGKFTVMPHRRLFTLQQNFRIEGITRSGLIPD